MERFLARHATRIAGVVSGFDRRLFRGTLRSISFVDGMDKFLASQRILYKDFAAFAARLTARVRAHAEELARQTGRPLEYLRSSSISKAARARSSVGMGSARGARLHLLLRRIVSGADRAWGSRDQTPAPYFYYLDRDFGLMHVRRQTGLPLPIQIYVNGREWLARQLTAAGVAYEPQDNAVIPDDVARAAAMSDRLLSIAWEPWLTRYAVRVNPWLGGRSLSPLLLERA